MLGPSGKQSADGKFDAKRFFVRPDRFLDIITSSFSLLLRLGSGATVSGYSVGIEKDDPTKYALFRALGFMTAERGAVSSFRRPAQPLELYEFEGCPFCRKVREAVHILDLDVLFYPCPKGGATYRPRAIQLGGKSQFPYLVDPNTGTAMYESDDIIKYLFQQYGDGAVPGILQGPQAAITAGLALIPRLGRGSAAAAGAKQPAQPLQVWGYEPSPFSKVVREVLNELEIAHVWHCSARGSPKRQDIFEKTGTFQVPYLEDPNTGVKMFESAEIVDYLRSTYQA